MNRDVYILTNINHYNDEELYVWTDAYANLAKAKEDMIADFKACGGFLLLATGFRIAKIHDFPVADMIPAMVLVMPVSWFWVNMIVPVL